MLFPMFAAGSEIPESVKAQWPFWYLLMSLLLVLAIMDCITVQIIAIILNILLIGLAFLIVRKDFEAAPTTSIMYGVLCVLNLVFSLIPLIQDLGGRTMVTDGPATSVVVNGVERVEIHKTFTTTPFFSGSQGFKYNLQSAYMILDPLVMLFGTIISFKVAYDIGQAAQNEEDVEGQAQGFAGGRYGGGAYRDGYGVGGGRGDAGGGSGGGSQYRGGQRNQQNFQPFSGAGQTLGG